MRVAIAGATGLVGGCCLRALLENLQVDGQNGVCSSVIALTRKPMTLNDCTGKHTLHPPVFSNQILDFEQLISSETPASSANRSPSNNPFENANISTFICCLGTTQKIAGSREAFRRVDFDYCYHLAKLAKQAGVQKLCVISAIGASPSSPVFYSRVKGELEAVLTDLEFDELCIFRPSLLIGKRQDKRPTEELGICLAPLFNPLLGIKPLRKYQAIEAELVGRAIALTALSPVDSALAPKVAIYTYDEIVSATKA